MNDAVEGDVELQELSAHASETVETDQANVATILMRASLADSAVVVPDQVLTTDWVH